MRNREMWTFLVGLSGFTSLAIAEYLLSEKELETLPRIEMLDEQQIDEKLLWTDEYQIIDPLLHVQSNSWHIQRTAIAEMEVVRVVPQWNGIPVADSDRVFVFNQRKVSWVSGSLPDDSKAPSVTGGFSLSRQEARRIAAENSLDIGKRDNQTEKEHSEEEEEDFVAEKTFVNGRPAWRIFDFALPLAERKSVLVDAERGAVIASHDVVCRDQALVYEQFPGEPFLTDIPHVIQPSPRNGGVGLYGKIFRGFNACQSYRCLPPQNNSDGACDEDHSVCASDGRSSCPGCHSIQYWFELDGRLFDVNRDWAGEGFPNGKIQAVWDKAPALGPRLEKPENQSWGSNIDHSAYSNYDPDDAFAELQVYYYFSRHHKFMAELMGNYTDPGPCLNGKSCTNPSDLVGNSVPSTHMPFRYIVNLQSRRLPSPETDGNPTIEDQIKMGRGKSEAFPVLFNDSVGLDSAFYSPSPKNFDPFQVRDCLLYRKDSKLIPSCLSVMSAKFPYIAFGQSRRNGDYALNNCVAYHELTHAFVYQFHPNFPKFSWSTAGGGIVSDPGALNEAWADYFAAINCGVERLAQEHPRRNLINKHTCSSMYGEVHLDSLVFSGALWSIRAAILTRLQKTPEEQRKFDAIVLTGMIAATVNETFYTQAQRLIDLVRSEPSLEGLASYAKWEFSNRVFNCSRFKEVHYHQHDFDLYLAGADKTPKNISIHSTQIKIVPRNSDWHIKIHWTQKAQTELGLLSTGFATKPMYALVSFDCPIELVEHQHLVKGGLLMANGTSVTGRCRGSSDQAISWRQANVVQKGNDSVGSLKISYHPSTVKAIYIVLAHADPVTKILQGINVETTGFIEKWPLVMIVISGVSALVDIAAALMLLKAGKAYDEKATIMFEKFNHNLHSRPLRDTEPPFSNLRFCRMISTVFYLLSVILAVVSLLSGAPLKKRASRLSIIFPCAVSMSDLAFFLTVHYLKRRDLVQWNFPFVVSSGVMCVAGLGGLVISFLTITTSFAVHMAFSMLFALSALARNIFGLLTTIDFTKVPISSASHRSSGIPTPRSSAAIK